jgi:hypothetical protein
MLLLWHNTLASCTIVIGTRLTIFRTIATQNKQSKNLSQILVLFVVVVVVLPVDRVTFAEFEFACLLQTFELPTNERIVVSTPQKRISSTITMTITIIKFDKYETIRKHTDWHQ